MQYNIHNQYNGLFTCIMDYLHALCIILMVLSGIVCMTLMVFIYVYYGLFVCTNLVVTMLLFFTVFWFHLPIFDKNHPVSDKIRLKIIASIFGENRPIYR
jgi:small-conductance mechanosensitive channel